MRLPIDYTERSRPRRTLKLPCLCGPVRSVNFTRAITDLDSVLDGVDHEIGRLGGLA